MAEADEHLSQELRNIIRFYDVFSKAADANLTDASQNHADANAEAKSDAHAVAKSDATAEDKPEAENQSAKADAHAEAAHADRCAHLRPHPIFGRTQRACLTRTLRHSSSTLQPEPADPREDPRPDYHLVC